MPYDTYRRELRAASWTQKLKRKRMIYRDAYYRAAGMMYGSDRYASFLAYMIGAFLLGPRYVFFKLNRQIFSKGSLAVTHNH